MRLLAVKNSIVNSRDRRPESKYVGKLCTVLSTVADEIILVVFPSMIECARASSGFDATLRQL
jgi:hypothetical protein